MKRAFLFTCLITLLTACQLENDDPSNGNTDPVNNPQTTAHSDAPPADLFEHYYHPQTTEEVAEERLQYIRQHGSFRMLGPVFPQRASSAGNWSDVGPGGSRNTCPNIEPRYTYAGRIISFGQDYDNHDLMYAGGASGGLWRSKDGGSSWEVILDDLPHPSVSTIEVNPGEPGEVWIGTGDRGNGARGNAAPSIGMVYKSEDGGDNWTQVEFASTNIAWISRIMIKPKVNSEGNDIIFIATSKGLYRGTEGGDWVQITEIGNQQISDVMVVGSILSQDFHAVAAEDDGNNLWYNDANGVTGKWEQKNLPGVSTFGRVSLAASDKGFHDKVYANVATPGGGWAGVWRSDDKGDNWSQVTHPAGGSGGQMNFNNTIEVENVNGDRVYTGTNSREIFISEDGGNSWYKSSDNNPIGNIHEDQQFMLQHVSIAATIYIANDGGIYRTTDRGQSFEGMGNDFLPLGQIYHLTLSPNEQGTYYIGTQDVGLMRGPDQFNRWQQLTCCDGGDITFKDSLHYSTIIGLSATNDNRYQYPPTKDVCQPWEGFANGLPAGAPWGANLIWSGQFFYTDFPGSILYRTADESILWTPIMDFKDEIHEIDAQTDGNDESVIVGVDKENPVRVANRYNNTFHKPDEPDAFWEDKRVTDIEIIKSNSYGHEVVMGLSGTSGIRVVKSYNSGNNWTDLTGDLPDMVNVRSITADPNNTDFIYIGTDFGVYVTNDGGINWFKYDAGLPAVSYVNDIRFDENFNQVVAGTYGRGVFVSEAADPSVGIAEVDDNNSLQVFPNPARSHLNVEWSNNEGPVSITVKSINGQQLITTQAMGHATRLNIGELNTGTYLVEIQSDDGEVAAAKRFVKLD